MSTAVSPDAWQWHPGTAAHRIRSSLERIGVLPEILFHQLDADGDGYLSREDLDPLFAGMSPERSAKEIDAVFDRFDENRDGKVELVEFCSAVRAPDVRDLTAQERDLGIRPAPSAWNIWTRLEENHRLPGRHIVQSIQDRTASRNGGRGWWIPVQDNRARSLETREMLAAFATQHGQGDKQFAPAGISGRRKGRNLAETRGAVRARSSPLTRRRAPSTRSTAAIETLRSFAIRHTGSASASLAQCSNQAWVLPSAAGASTTAPVSQEVAANKLESEGSKAVNAEIADGARKKEEAQEEYADSFDSGSERNSQSSSRTNSSGRSRSHSGNRSSSTSSNAGAQADGSNRASCSTTPNVKPKIPVT